MCPCKCCHRNKQDCSLMLVNRNTGKTDQRNLTEADIFRFCVGQLENLKKQQACGHKNPEASGSKTSPSTMLSAIDLESWSSHSPPAAPDSPVVATATALPHPSSHTQPCLAAPVAGDFSAPIKVTALHAVNFYVEVSAPAKAANKAPTSSKYPSAAAAITPTPLNLQHKAPILYVTSRNYS
jgi:hypothetical protein